jgi:hypothetical protein
MRASRYLLVPLAASLLVLFSCTDNATGPGVGSGNLLEASVNGTKLTFDVASDIIGFNTYTAATNEARFAGSAVGATSKSLTLRATYDLDKGPFPKTLTGDDVSIIFIEPESTGTVTYNCLLGSSNCSITLTASNGVTVDGTFNATLSASSDTTQKVTITNGTFSVKLKRQ